MPCSRCGRQDGTVIPAHYSGLCSHRLGKGGKIKAHDLVADLCSTCHSYMDGYDAGNDPERGLEFLICILRSFEARKRQGKIIESTDGAQFYWMLEHVERLAELFVSGELEVR